MTLERDDIGGAPTDPLMVAMHRLAEPNGLARDDYDIFADLSARLGTREAFTEGRSSREWLRHLYAKTQAALRERGLDAPDFDGFWERGELILPQQDDDGGILRAFRNDPAGKPLPTPSGKVQIVRPWSPGSATRIALVILPGWPEDARPRRRIPVFGRHQPASRLHSQLISARTACRRSARAGKSARCIRADAAERGIAEGDVVRLFNARGACLAAARLTEDIRPGVVQLPTGAWYDPEDADAQRPLCVHGNPNVLTRDVGTSSLAQGCSGQLTAVQVERYTGPAHPIRAHEPPAIGERP